MKNLLYIAIITLAFIACNSNKKQGANASLTIEKEINIENLQESFAAKDETQFLAHFPKNFEQFHRCFSWNSEIDEPEELYDEANKYIDYFFELINNESHKVSEKSIIEICKNGHWEADAINYFQNKALNYIKLKQKYHLINELNITDAKSVLFFLFDSPHPKFDEDFASHLRADKKEIFNSVFEKKLFDQHDIDEDLSQNNILFYTNNDAYFIKDIDINNDGVLDKVVSSERYQGDELLLFVNNNNSYEFALKTTNFSEDGGNQIVDIKKDENGFVVVTAFPDRGFYEANYFISLSSKIWLLTQTIYKTQSSNQEDAFVYVCRVIQNIDLSNPKNLTNIKGMPDEIDREKKCVKEKLLQVSSFLPKDYVVSKKIFGDLNNDGHEDCILIIKDTDKNNSEVANQFGKKVDRNRRGIIVLFNKKGSYQLATKNYDCFYSENEDGGNYYAPQLSFETKNGNLIVNFEHGRYGYWSYTFRFQNSEFNLIGYNSTNTYGPITNTITSINFLTKKKLIRENTNENSEGNDEVFKDTWSPVKIDKLIKLSDIKDFEELDLSVY